jgi:hypothetical protein
MEIYREQNRYSLLRTSFQLLGAFLLWVARALAFNARFRVIYILSCVSFFVLMIARPGGLGALRYGLFAIVVGGTVVGQITGKFRPQIHLQTLLLCISSVAVGALSALNGLRLDSPGALRSTTVHVLWPLLFTYLGAALPLGSLAMLIKIMVSTCAGIVLFLVLYIGDSLIPGTILSFVHLLDLGQEMSIIPGGIKLSSYSMTSLLFIVPYLVATVFFLQHSEYWPNVLTSVAITVCAVLLSIVSGRMALVIAIPIAVLACLFVKLSVPIENHSARSRAGLRILLVLVTIGIVVLFHSGWNLVDVLVTRVNQYIGSTGAQDARIIQFPGLMQGWAERPWFGAGLGAVADGPIRDDSMPWAYELSYVSLLFQGGVITVLVYAAGIYWIFLNMFKVASTNWPMKNQLICLCIGLFCFLAGNATNPYLGTFDSMWVIFLPVALINHALNDLRDFSRKTSLVGQSDQS